MLLPSLPVIDGDYNIMLDVFTHSTARQPDTDDDVNQEYGNVERLENLGRKAAELAVTYQFFFAQELPASDIPRQCSESLVSTKILEWMNEYGMMKNVRCFPHNLRENADDMASIFFAYVGAVYIRNGAAVVQRWFSQLVDPENAPPDPPAPSSAPAMPNNPLSHTSPPPQPQLNYPQQAQPAPPSGPPPPPPPANPMDQFITLQMFNQTAQQKGRTVTYNPTSVGPPHAPLWTVQCLVDDQVVATSNPVKTQKAAKEEAARIAFRALGWP